MADNVLRGIVQITAPGVQQTFDKVAASTAKAEQGLKKLAPSANSANLALINTGRVVQDLPFGFLGIANNLNPLLESFQRLKAETGSTKTALRSLGSSLMGAGGVGFALSLVSSALIVFGDKLFGAGKAAKEAKSATDKLKESINGIFSEVAKEASQVGSLVTILREETETRDRKLRAIQELQKIQPEIFKGLKLEGEAVVGLDDAYKNYLVNLKNIIAAKIIQAKLEQKIEQLLKLQGAGQTKLEKTLLGVGKEFQKRLGILADQNAAGSKFRAEMDKEGNEVKRLEDDIQGLFESLSEFEKFIKLPALSVSKTTKEVEKLTTAFGDLGAVKTSLGRDDLRKLFPTDGLPGFRGAIILPIKFQFDPIDPIKDFRLQEVGKELDAIFSGFGQNLFQSLGEGIGDAISGQKNGLDAIFGVFSTLLKQIGEALIKYGVIKEGLDKILGPGGIALPGAFAIGLGIAAVAAATLLKSFSGARAMGGPVSAGGTYLVGENGPELFRPSTGGEIIPNNRLGSSGITGSGVMVSGTIRNILSGKDLVQLIELQNQSNRRLI